MSVAELRLRRRGRTASWHLLTSSETEQESVQAAAIRLSLRAISASVHTPVTVNSMSGNFLLMFSVSCAFSVNVLFALHFQSGNTLLCDRQCAAGVTLTIVWVYINA